MASQSLLSLPPETLQEVLVRLDPPSLCAVAETCRAMRDAVDAPSIWRAHLARRFRIQSLQFRGLIARPAKDVYAQWHRQQRMPRSRLTNQRTTVFAQGVETTPCPLQQYESVTQYDTTNAMSQFPSIQQPSWSMDAGVQSFVPRDSSQTQIQSRPHRSTPITSSSNSRCACQTKNVALRRCICTSSHHLRDHLRANSVRASSKAKARLYKVKPNSGSSVLAWVIVNSTDDCRVGTAGLQLRLILQNIGIHRVTICPTQLHLQLTTGEKLHVSQKSGTRCHSMRCNDCSCGAKLMHKRHAFQYHNLQAPTSVNRCDAASALSPHSCVSIVRPSSTLRNSHHDFTTLETPANTGELHLSPHGVYVDRANIFIASVPNQESCIRSLSTNDAASFPFVLFLDKDDFCTISLRLKLPDAVHEVDVLERLDVLSVPLYRRYDQQLTEDVINMISPRSFENAPTLIQSCVHAEFAHNTIWQNYEQMPGGWWARRDVTDASLSNRTVFPFGSTATRVIAE